jgi:hypothetical protein
MQNNQNTVEPALARAGCDCRVQPHPSPQARAQVWLTELAHQADGMMTRAAFLLVTGVIVLAQNGPPRFEDFPAPIDWKESATAPTLTTRSERLFHTRLLQAAKEPPNFATHYRFTMWGCGSECASGAIIDLATGQVIAPPLVKSSTMSFSLCQSAYEGFGVEVRPDSRLMIVRCGLNYDEQLQRNVPDVYYFVLDGQGFRKLAQLHGKEAALLSK